MSKAALIAFFLNTWPINQAQLPLKAPYSKISIVNVLLLELSIHGTGL